MQVCIMHDIEDAAWIWRLFLHQAPRHESRVARRYAWHEAHVLPELIVCDPDILGIQCCIENTGSCTLFIHVMLYFSLFMIT